MPRVIVIGAGWYGLVVSKTYLQLYPDVDLTIIDGDNTVGGVWSKDRLYPNLFAQITYPLFEYYDVPMRAEGLSPEGYISGDTIHTYLKEFAERFKLVERIRFSNWVDEVVRTADGGWLLSVRDKTTGVTEQISCDKLIVANGPTSKPLIPKFPGQLSIPSIHSKDIGTSMNLLEDPTLKRVTVIGAAKSAYDAVYLAMKAGKQVDWIIRTNGAGAMNMYPPTYLKILNIMDLACLRVLSKLSPSIMQTGDWWYAILQKSWAGSRITAGFWKTVTALNNWYAGYSKSENAEKLRPTPNNAMWCNNGLGCMSVGMEFWDLFHSGLASVHRGEVGRLAGTSIFLKDGTELPQQGLVIYCTGWNDDIPMFNADTTKLLGLPSRQYELHDEKMEQKERLAEEKIEEMFPLLRNVPKTAPNAEKKQRAWSLYRRIAAPRLAAQGDRSIAFMGQIHSISTAMLSGVQALWIVSFLEGHIKLPNQAAMEDEAAAWNAWTCKRYLDAGKKFPYSIYDFLPYIDALCRDMGINPARKSNFITEHFTPYGPRDYRTIVHEWKALHGHKIKGI